MRKHTDLIFTAPLQQIICATMQGTPFGVGLGLSPQRWLKAGEVVTVEIDKIGKLTNPVREAP